MPRCSHCQTLNPEGARFCMHCGRSLEPPQAPGGFGVGGVNLFLLSIAGSLALSLLLWSLGIPIFFLAAFLPLFWSFRNKRD